MKLGEHFGEQSAFNDLPNPYTIEALTPKVELYKIHRANFIQYFGGLGGEPLAAIRASIVLKHNWLRMKLDFLKTFTEEQLSQLEYRNEEEFVKLRPTRQLVKEIPYIKNNPKQQKVLEQNGEPGS